MLANGIVSENSKPCDSSLQKILCFTILTTKTPSGGGRYEGAISSIIRVMHGASAVPLFHL